MYTKVTENCQQRKFKPIERDLDSDAVRLPQYQNPVCPVVCSSESIKIVARRCSNLLEVLYFIFKYLLNVWYNPLLLQVELFSRDLFWRTQYTARALVFCLKKNQIVPSDRYLLVLQELSDEEKTSDYINALDIIDREHIEENYTSNSENEVNGLQDIADLSDEESDANESNFMKTIYKTKTVKASKIVLVIQLPRVFLLNESEDFRNHGIPQQQNSVIKTY
ncbi:hypothetical protein AVEN_173571-3 [Araneus ventricosus]|uniref:Uncharacterized protein n=1 Tax=Araneus ventricosus TaxID=182803 RepID=A0A4Y2CS99_ARAVE|nr:hypothetical protein AVEN_173571-3 [Araneus ventricosus]